MSGDISSRLDALLAERDAERQKYSSRVEENIRKANAAEKRFLELRDDVVRPAMEEVGRWLVGKNIQFEIDCSNYVLFNSSYPAIEFEMVLDERGRGYSNPFYRVVWNHDKVELTKNVRIYGGGTQASKAGDITLEELTKEKVQDDLLDVIKTAI
ncbi:hypothetical protein [Dyella sp.]|uniref:hypothetical protein n=1 Tax=Dyella sp. TaxID=1869338 RepID=UPI002B466924|nr:hypothetical protein [Dyella sp.]HKT28770.1 hypothetical protein [Dyella sp.]